MAPPATLTAPRAQRGGGEEDEPEEDGAALVYGAAQRSPVTRAAPPLHTQQHSGTVSMAQHESQTPLESSGFLPLSTGWRDTARPRKSRPGGTGWAMRGFSNGPTHFEPEGASVPVGRQGDAVTLSTTGAWLPSPVAAPEVLQQVPLGLRNAAMHVSERPAMAASVMAASVEHAAGSSSLADRAQDSAGVERKESEQEAADRSLALRLHAEEVAAEAVRRKRAREVFLAGGPPNGKTAAAANKRSKRGPLDIFLKK